MFERFTNRARHAVVLAQEEARRLDHMAIDTEHVLLGLLGEPEAIAGRVLGQLGITLPAARADVEGLVGRGDGAPSGHIPFTPRAKKVLELSLREALALGHNYIGTEHILLGIVREGDGVAVAVLEQRGATGPTIRALVQAAVAEAGAAAGALIPATGVAERRTDGADAVIAAARQLAGSGPIGTHHLLEAMTLVDDSLASNVLGALGIAPDALAGDDRRAGDRRHDGPQPRGRRRPADGAARHRRERDDRAGRRDLDRAGAEAGVVDRHPDHRRDGHPRSWASGRRTSPRCAEPRSSASNPTLTTTRSRGRERRRCGRRSATGCGGGRAGG
jgi:ATP-dependent Clp protease ATP-binding subunit ClpC